MEICPACGSFEDSLDPVSGWCAQCTMQVFTSSYRINAYYVSRLEQWYARNANLLDRLLSIGFTQGEARNIAQFLSSKSFCIRCGTVFRRNPKGQGESLFCKSNDLCKRAARSYRYLRETKRLSRQQAIEKVTADGTN